MNVSTVIMKDLDGSPKRAFASLFSHSFLDLFINTGVMNVGNRYLQIERKKKHDSQSNVVTATHFEW